MGKQITIDYDEYLELTKNSNKEYMEKLKYDANYYKNYAVEKSIARDEIMSDLEYVLKQVYGAFTQNWCIDFNFTDIREKYNIRDNNEVDNNV